MRYSLPIFALSAHLLFANPHGFKVIAGDASPPKESSAGLTIQSGSQAIIQWDHFSIDENRFVQFNQHDQNSAVLNRVIGGSESSLLGSLISNGKVYLINPNGVLIGPNGRIETAGFLASTADVLNDDFLQGKELLFGDLGVGKIVHLGTIECPTGDVTLLARMIDAPGNIHAPNGIVLLLQPKGQPDIFIDAGGGGAEPEEGCALHQSGLIEALKIELKTSPNPYLKAIRCDGVLEAIEGVYIHAEGGLAEVSGQIHCDSGTVHLLGEKVFLIDQAKVDVSGDSGGGTILVGGDYLGQNPDVPSSDYLFVGSDTVLDARCRENGNGGKVILWGVKGNHHYGAIHATGGPKGGDGGFVEISSLGDLQPKGFVSTLAPMGKIGTLLFDPTDVTINTSADSGAAPSGCPGAGCTYTFSAATANILNTEIQGFLGSNNVTINATVAGQAGTGSILVNAPITWSQPTTLTLTASGSVPGDTVHPSISFKFSGAITNNYGGPTLFDALVCSTTSTTSSIGILFFPPSGSLTFQTSYGNMRFTANTTSTTVGTLTRSAIAFNGAGAPILFNSSGTGATAGSFFFNGTTTGPTSLNGIFMWNQSTSVPITIQTLDGNISLIGSTAGTQDGIQIQQILTTSAPITIQTTATTSGQGNITITGTAVNAASSGISINATGPLVSSPVSIVANNLGNISISGTNTSTGLGVFFENPVVDSPGSPLSITSNAGNINITGTTTGGTDGVEFDGLIAVTTSSGNMTISSTTLTTITTDTAPTLPSFQTTSGNITFSGPVQILPPSGTVGPTIGPTSGSITFTSTLDGDVDLSLAGGAGVTIDGAAGGSIPLDSLIATSSNGNVQVANVTTVGLITLQPASGFTPTALGNIPTGIIRLNGNLTSTTGGAISLAATGRTTTMSIATIASSLAGNNVTISGASVTFGNFEAITVLGTLTITTPGVITIGDAVALNGMSLTGSNFIINTHGNESILNALGGLYTSPSVHFISSSTPTTTPTPSGVNIAAFPLLNIGLLQYAPDSYVLNFDTTLTICVGSCAGSSSCPTCPSCGGSSSRNIHPFGFIVNQEVVANSQLLELLPIFDREFYWPYYGVICEGGDKANCVSPYFETFSWNNDVE